MCVILGAAGTPNTTRSSVVPGRTHYSTATQKPQTTCSPSLMRAEVPQGSCRAAGTRWCSCSTRLPCFHGPLARCPGSLGSLGWGGPHTHHIPRRPASAVLWVCRKLHPHVLKVCRPRGPPGSAIWLDQGAHRRTKHGRKQSSRPLHRSSTTHTAPPHPDRPGPGAQKLRSGVSNDATSLVPQLGGCAALAVGICVQPNKTPPNSPLEQRPKSRATRATGGG